MNSHRLNRDRLHATLGNQHSAQNGEKERKRDEEKKYTPTLDAQLEHAVLEKNPRANDL